MPMEKFHKEYWHVFLEWRGQYGEPHWVRRDAGHVELKFRVNKELRLLVTLEYTDAEEKADRLGLHLCIEKAGKIN